MSASLCAISLSFSMYSESAAGSETEEPQLTAPAWFIEIPSVPTKFDWLLVHKGELLGGDIIAMYDERVEFDSDEVGVHKVKMKDIKELRTKDIMQLRFLDGTIIEGHLVIDEEHVYTMELPAVTYPRENILSITPSEKSGDSLWTGNLSLGFNLKSGNTESVDFYGNADVRYLVTTGRFNFTYRAMYEQVKNSDSGSSVVTEDNHRFTAQYDYFYSHQLYFTLPSYDLLLDELKNIKYQTSLGVAVGYEVIDITGLDINVYAGPSAQHTEFVNVEAGADEKVFSPALAFGLDFEYDITSDLEYFLVYDAKVVNKESGRFIQRIETGFDIEIVDDFDLELMTIIDNTAEPIADENGVQPKATDVVFTVGIEYEF
jgi:putative salt-induced outer membrane protein YdiY